MANDHHGHPDADVFRRRFWINLVLALPVVAYSEMVQEWLGYTPPGFPGDHLVAPLLGTVIFVYGGWVFLEGGWQEARRWQPGMMLLISLAITVAFVASLATTLGYVQLEFWWEVATLIVVMLLGHWQEMRAVGQARGALTALAELLPDQAEVVGEGEAKTIPIAELQPGDVVLVRPGARVPADGEVVEGRADLDESMITGESKPVSREMGPRVVAGTVAIDSALRVRVEAVGEDTALAGIQRLVAEAQTSGSRAQALADRAAAWLFYVAVATAGVTFVVWTALGQAGPGVSRTVTVLVIACPHALGLAIPLVIALGTAISARQGILVKDRLALERTRLVDVVLFDKTGTLTRGEHAVSAVMSSDGSREEVLGLAAAAETDSEHPLARAIVAKARADGARVSSASDFRAMAGRGVEATVEGSRVAVGGPALVRERELGIASELDAEVAAWRERGAAILYVARDDQVVGAVALEDQVRPESREVVDALHQLGIEVAMITGDARQVAEAVGAELGIDEIYAEVLPEEKDAVVARLQEEGRTVAMVGDGVNDAPALARADVGIAIGAGTDVAIESAGVVLVSDDPRGVLGAVRLSRAGYRKMVQNLAWAAGYNVVALPLAAGVAAPVGFVLAPAVGALLMSLSTVIVALNAQLLRGLDLRAPE